jgi:NAD(P)-dependent dehydrogenase (short-subunit alcohol dehydrogenase family)
MPKSNGERPTRFANRVAWVTGAASGMGERHAHRLADEGAAVGVIDIDVDGARHVAAAIVREGGRAEAVEADVARWEDMAAAAAGLEERLGRVSVVIANAGIIPPVSTGVAETSPGTWDRVVDVCLSGAFHTAKAALPQLRAGGGGSIVFISSTAGLCGFAEYASYVAAKHGVIGLMRSLANEVAADGIRVNAVCPGTTDTPALDKEAASLGISRNELVQAEVATHLIRRLVRPDEISDAVLWLCSQDAGVVTGIELPVDGGFLVRRELV